MKDIVLTSQAFDDLQFWSANNIKLIKKILELLESVNQNPFAGLGKPEALKGNLRGY